MDRAEQAGLGVAVIGHVALFGALSLGLLAAPELPKIDSQPVEVTLIEDVDLRSATPMPAPEVAAEPQPALAPPPAPAPQTLPAAAPPPPPPAPKAEPKAEPKVAPPKPTPKAAAKPETKPKAKLEPKPKPVEKAATKPSAKAKDKPAAKPTRTAALDPEARRRPGLSGSIVSGLSDTPTPTPAKPTKPGKTTGAPTAAPATATTKAPAGISVAQMTGAQKSSLNALIYTQLKPYWKPPSGADAEQLITRLSVRLNKDGSLADDPELIDQQGINDSNRTQAKLHAERAIQAVRRAAPFKLPPEYYEAWKWLKPLKLYVGQPG